MTSAFAGFYDEDPYARASRNLRIAADTLADEGIDADRQRILRERADALDEAVERDRELVRKALAWMAEGNAPNWLTETLRDAIGEGKPMYSQLQPGDRLRLVAPSGGEILVTVTEWEPSK